MTDDFFVHAWGGGIFYSQGGIAPSRQIIGSSLRNPWQTLNDMRIAPITKFYILARKFFGVI